MSDHDKILAALERIERNQAQALQMQAEQIAMARTQMEKTDAKVKESIALQEIAVRRQARAMGVLLPIVSILGALALYLALRH